MKPVFIEKTLDGISVEIVLTDYNVKTSCSLCGAKIRLKPGEIAAAMSGKKFYCSKCGNVDNAEFSESEMM